MPTTAGAGWDEGTMDQERMVKRRAAVHRVDDALADLRDRRRSAGAARAPTAPLGRGVRRRGLRLCFRPGPRRRSSSSRPTTTGSPAIAHVERALARGRRARAERAERLIIQRRFDTLTRREREVLGLVVAGLLNKQVAFNLGAAEKTVKIHRGRVMHKMQVESVADLVRMTQRIGIEPSKTS